MIRASVNKASFDTAVQASTTRHEGEWINLADSLERKENIEAKVSLP